MGLGIGALGGTGGRGNGKLGGIAGIGGLGGNAMGGFGGLGLKPKKTRPPPRKLSDPMSKIAESQVSRREWMHTRFHILLHPHTKSTT